MFMSNSHGVKWAPALACVVLAWAQVQPALADATRLPFRSSFETGSFSEWHGGLDARMTVTQEQASDGRYSVRASMQSGTGNDNYKEFRFGDHSTVRGTPVNVSDGLWLTFDSKFDSGFQFSRSARFHKIAILNLEDENARRRYQVVLNVRTSDGQYFIEHLKWNADRSFNRALPGMEQNVGTPVRASLGQWDRLKLFVKPNTRGGNDGIIRLWVNDELKAQYTSVALREATDYMPNKLIMSNYAPEGDTIGNQRWDNFYLGEDVPADVVRPNPPVLDRVQ